MRRLFSFGLLFSLTSSFASGPADYADPLIGTDGHGHAFPGALVPFGMVQLSPDTRTDTWDGSSGYHYSDRTILGFSHTHLSGTGVGCLGDIMLMPEVGPLDLSEAGYSSPFSHKQEVAKPGFYQVFLQKPKVSAELTATPRAGFHKYTFPKSDRSRIVLDLLHGVSSDPHETYLKVENRTTLTGYRKSGGWGGERTAYFAIRFSRPFDQVDIEQGGRLVSGLTEAKGRVKAAVGYKTRAGEAILVKVGISATGVAGAMKNLDTEIPNWNFAQVRTSAERKWNDVLGAIEVQTADPKLRRTFYSNAYLSYIAPSLFNDVDGAYMGMDHKVHRDVSFQNYTTFSLWDTYRALHPLLTLTQPKRVADLTSSLLAEYRESGLHTTPIWPLWGNETWCMIGYHSVPVLVDAYFKGLLGPNAESVYQAMRDTSMQNYNGLNTYKSLGYVASRAGAQATSKTIEYSVDDWCLARMADALGHHSDAQLFYRRSSNYRNHFDATTRFMRGRKASGAWRIPFDNRGLVGDEYTEADAWQYAFAVQHDIPGLVSLYGGDAKFVQRMDEMFAMDSRINTNIPDITGRMGQYAQGNEQCHHQAYLYDFAGAPWKTQARVRKIMASFYDDTPGGQIGNNDCGQMSAWYVFSAIGFYPVNPSNGVYVLGSPAVDRASIRIGGGRSFTVVATNNVPNNPYVQSATLDGKPFTRCWISHREVLKGGTLKLVMGPKPNKSWGASLAARPLPTMPAGFHYAALPTPSSDKPVALRLPIRIVCGNDDPVGNFIPDPNMIEGMTNSIDTSVDTSAPNSAPAGVYKSERYGSDFTYRFPVPKGRAYTVRLHFAEVFGDTPGQRVENISINGRRVLTNFDPVVAAGGPNKAVVREFTAIQPGPDGRISIRIQAAKGSPDQNAKISAIEILP